eukprot:4521183-Heterocapsa_arctica.AAC.1
MILLWDWPASGNGPPLCPRGYDLSEKWTAVIDVALEEHCIGFLSAICCALSPHVKYLARATHHINPVMQKLTLVHGF